MNAAKESAKKLIDATTREEIARALLVMNEDDSHALTASLRREGVETHVAANGAAALVLLKRLRPHVVIAHADLRGIRGGELAGALRQGGEGAPVIIIGNADATTARRIEAVDAGAFDYFKIPDESALMLRQMRQLVALKQQADALRAEADRDYLTGLANRRRFRTALGAELERFRRYKTPCALLLADVDFLKKINDAHGHSAGDMAIRHVAAALAGLSRNNDTAARLGGEEFALLLAGADERSAAAAAERLRHAVESETLEQIGAVTISVGVACCPAHANSERTLYASSDRALYRAKESGRNRVVVASM